MTLHVVAEFRAATGQEDRLRTALEAMIEPTLSEAGCLAYQPYIDPNDAAHMVLVEEWTSEAALDEHFATAHFAHVAEVLERILAEPFVLRKLVAA